MTGKVEDMFMERCLELAGMAEGLTYPNPMVGAVIVHNGRIIGEGYHRKAGGPHAEVIAVDSVKDKSLLKGSTLYVSLEPCCHYGKTPPCTEMIISLQIPSVVIGTKDTSSKVMGKGAELLTKAGINVITGVLEDKCRRLNRRFFSFHEKKRPYVTLKWAQSADGFIDIVRPPGSSTGPYWISGTSERVLVHRWRSEEQAVLVGAGTVRTDNPLLNVRYWKGNDPLKLILSGSGDLSEYYAENETKTPSITFTYNAGPDPGNSARVILRRDYPSASQIVEYLYDQGFQSLFIEGGAMVLSHFIETGLWDEARIFKGMKDFGSGVKAPRINGKAYYHKSFPASSLEVILNG